MTRNLSCSVCSRTITGYKKADNNNLDSYLYLCPSCAEKLKKVDIKIGEYTILCEIGKGGMSVVYKAWHSPTQRIVALKKVLPEIAVYEKAKKIFQREALVMEQLTHPNIVRLLHQCMTENYLVFEYVSGGNLYTYAQKNSLLTVCRVLCNILDGIDYIHKKGLIHGDIKPSNILMSHTETGKLSDFNLARSFDNPLIDNPDQINKTPVFMAPEEVINTNVGPAIDIYCLGVSMYYLFTGKFPLTLPEPNDLVKALLKEKRPEDPIKTILRHKKELQSQYRKVIKKMICKADRVPVLHYRDDIPLELAHIIDKTVHIHERDRFTSAGEMKNALTAFIARYI